MANFMNQVNLGGIDEIVQNSRVRATATAGTNAQGVLWMQGTGVPASLAAGNQTLTAAQIGGGLVVMATGAGNTLTLDTPANIINYMNANSAGIQVGDIIQCFVGNGSGANALTIAAGAGGTIDANGSGTIPANSSKTLNIRITNITSPAYTVYL